MNDMELKLAELRAEADQVLRDEEDWGDITIPARLLLEILDRVQPKYHRGDKHPHTPLRT